MNRDGELDENWEICETSDVAKGDASPSTLNRGLSILELIVSSYSGVTLAELASALDLPRSTAHRLLSSMVKRDWLAVRGSPARYTATLRVAELGLHVLAQDRTRDVLISAAMELAINLRCQVLIGVYSHGDVLFTDQIQLRGERAIPRLTASRYPALAVACGRVMLAFQPEEEIERVLKQGWPPERTEWLPAEPRMESEDEVRRLLALIRERGYDIHYMKTGLMPQGIAMPVFTEPGRSRAAFGIPVMGATREEALEHFLRPAFAVAQQAASDLQYGSHMVAGI